MQVEAQFRLPTPHDNYRQHAAAYLTHLAQQLFPVLPPQYDSDHSQQQEDDAHQAANQDSRVTAVVLGHRESRPWSVGGKFWIYGRKSVRLTFGRIRDLPVSACVRLHAGQELTHCWFRQH